MVKRELVALFSLSSRRLVIVVWLFLAVPWVRLQSVIVVFPDHTHYFRSSRSLTKSGTNQPAQLQRIVRFFFKNHEASLTTRY